MAVPDTGLIIPNVFAPNDIDWTDLKGALYTSSVGALKTALDAIGTYDTSTADGVLNTAGGLTKHSVARTHNDVLRGQTATGFVEELAWLDEVTAGVPSLPVYVGADRVDAMKVGTADVDAVYLGSTKVWP